MEIVRKKYLAEFPFIRVARIESTASYRTPLQIHSESTQKGNNVLKSRKFQNNLCESVSFSLTLEPCSPEILTSNNGDYKKNVCFEYSEIVATLPEKGLF